MSEREKKIAQTLAEALKALPDDKKEYLIGYADGVAAMASGGKVPNESTESTKAG